MASSNEKSAEKSKLESMEKKDLITLLKKQMVLKQRLTTKCSELTVENENFNSQVLNYEKKQKEYLEEIERLKEQHSKATSEALERDEKNKLDLKEFESEVGRYKEEKINHLEEIEKLKNEIKKIENTIEEKETLIENLEENIKSLIKYNDTPTEEAKEEEGGGSSKEKMEEWEEMMRMMQMERNETTELLSKLESGLCKISSEVHRVVAMFERVTLERDVLVDMAGSEQKSFDSRLVDVVEELEVKVVHLKNMAEEMIFQHDEVKEKIVHLIEEDKGSDGWADGAPCEGSQTIIELFDNLDKKQKHISMSFKNELEKTKNENLKNSQNYTFQLGEKLAQIRELNEKIDQLSRQKNALSNEINDDVGNKDKSTENLKESVNKKKETIEEVDESIYEVKAPEDFVESITNVTTNNDSLSQHKDDTTDGGLGDVPTTNDTVLEVTEMTKELPSSSNDMMASETNIASMNDVKADSCQVINEGITDEESLTLSNEVTTVDNKEVISLQNELAELRSSYEESLRKISALETELKRLNDEKLDLLEGWEKEKSKFTEETKQQINTIERFKKENKRLEEDYRGKCLEMENLQKDLKEIDELRCEIESLKNEVKDKEDLKATMAALQSEIETYKKQAAERFENVIEENPEATSHDAESKPETIPEDGNHTEKEINENGEGCIESKEESKTEAEGFEEVKKELEELQQQLIEVNKQMEEKTERENKLKILAAKHKKEAADNKTLCEERGREIEELTKALEELREQNKEDGGRLKLREDEMVALKIQLRSLIEQKDKLEVGIKTKEEELEKEKKRREVEVAEVNEKMKVLEGDLQDAKKDMKQNEMLSLELSDYERTVKSLNEQLKRKEENNSQLQKQISHLGEQKKSFEKLISTFESQLRESEERYTQVNDDLMKNKKTLNEKETELMELKNEFESFKEQNSSRTEKLKEAKNTITSMEEERNKLQELMQGYLVEHENTKQTLQADVKRLSKDLSTALENVHKTQSEYDAYKIRVHSVFKQRKERKEDEFEAMQAKIEKENLHKENLYLKNQLQELSRNISELNDDKQKLEWQCGERGGQVEQLNARLKNVQLIYKEKLEKSTEKTQAEKQQLQKEIVELQEKLVREVEHKENMQRLLQQRLEEAANENEVLRSKMDVMLMPKMDVVEQKVFLMPVREDAEGSENNEKVATTSTHPLESILNTTFDHASTEELQQETKKLKEDLSTQIRQMSHLRELLNESEATVVGLSEQASVLKAEIRRLERNQERDKGLSNMEYLKNIFIKFVTIKVVEEKIQLVPVISTMLKLSPEEKALITGVAKGVESSQEEVAKSSWGSYINVISGGIL